MASNSSDVRENAVQYLHDGQVTNPRDVSNGAEGCHEHAGRHDALLSRSNVDANLHGVEIHNDASKHQEDENLHHGRLYDC